MPSQPQTDTRLLPGSIYIMLYVRTLDVSDGFHWALYHHVDSSGRGRGWKYHIRTLGDGWVTDHAQLTSVMGETFLVGLIRIGSCQIIPDDEGDGTIGRVVESVAHDAPPPDYDILTCRTWVLAVVRGLVKEGLVKADVGELEKEVKEWGAAHHASACDGVRPRVVSDSQVCKL